MQRYIAVMLPMNIIVTLESVCSNMGNIVVMLF